MTQNDCISLFKFANIQLEKNANDMPIQGIHFINCGSRALGTKDN